MSLASWFATRRRKATAAPQLFPMEALLGGHFETAACEYFISILFWSNFNFFVVVLIAF